MYFKFHLTDLILLEEQDQFGKEKHFIKIRIDFGKNNFNTYIRRTTFNKSMKSTFIERDADSDYDKDYDQDNDIIVKNKDTIVKYLRNEEKLE